jgi:copper oxidase (laccase) domain-containing protein
VELFHSSDSFLKPLQEAGFPVAFVPRIEGVAGSYDKEEGLQMLAPHHRKAVEGLPGYRWEQLWRAEQVHGDQIAAVGGEGVSPEMVAGVDGLMSHDPESLLGIYVADCGLLWLADQRTGAVSLLHSGRKGTEAGILLKAVTAMGTHYGTQAEDLLVVLGPCIRPPLYEVDIAKLLAEQAQEAGVGQFLDSGICTGAEVERYYSYRVEKGKTGRMLGLLASKRPEHS